MSDFCCCMCTYTSTSMIEFKAHFIRYHRNDPNFLVACCFNGCGFSTKRWGTFRVHYHRKHGNTNNNNANARDIVQNDHGDVDDESADEIWQEEQATPFVDVQKINAQFTLALETKNQLSKASVDRAVISSSHLLTDHLNNYKVVIQTHLQQEGIDASFLNNVHYSPGLEALSSSKQRYNYYFKHMVTYVKPEELLLGKRRRVVKGVIKTISDFGYIVPFKKNLENLLNMPEMFNFIKTPHKSPDDFVHDVCDGEYIQGNTLFNDHPSAIQIALSTDDLEIVNPLGTNIKKHKISLYYFSILNIPPQFRSRINSIQLLAIAKSKLVKFHGATKLLLNDFISTVNQMSTSGLRLIINREERVIFGTLVLVSADTLAAHELGQFKEGVAFALKCCRHCNIETEFLRTTITESECHLRDTITHRDRCVQLDSLNGKTKTYWSKIWGINGTSCLLDINNFEFIWGLAQDPMHVLLEGVVPYYMALALYNFIYVGNFLTLNQLNSKLSTFEYSHLHNSTKPCQIEKHHLDTKLALKQTSSCMLTLCETLPIIIGHYIPERNRIWVNLLRLIQVVMLCSSPYCSTETPNVLRLLIVEFLSEFKELHGRAPFIPKMHYMLHFPKQMRHYGPLRHHWCMRYEAKHTAFTQRKHKNFKNLPFSLIHQHQLFMCYVQSGSNIGRPDNFLYEGDIVGNGDIFKLADKYPNFIDRFDHNETLAFSTNKVKIHGLDYAVNSCSLVYEYDEYDIPRFGIVSDILVINHIKYFVLEIASSFLNQHIACYIFRKNGCF
ncbi:hypothetical protein LOTGIDRAFT_165435 [Lottia gigantea]|uniref:C2H2-type domain-containing protein n=1 Tax=Lottia gigantea TaxID=225164 RepID=V4A5U7_LOTGI|nr:hypothetical protein LOTGIDRAFT_165435 [Lottia gigantea]ESO88651.1 hypothetical protein LOTGIDRAFT_165435 [Lottia gigantea]